MANNQAPIFYHPTTVMAVDDDQDLLNAISAGISSNLLCVLHDNPATALKYLEENVYNLHDFSTSLLIIPGYTLAKGDSTETVEINFSSLRDKLNIPDRFKKTTVVIVDQKMPGMLGLEFAEKVRELKLPVKLLLLTGAAGAEQAVEAFNNGIIDAYISKGESELMEKVNKKVNDLCYSQFQEFGYEVQGLLSHQLGLLDCEPYKAVFTEIRDDNQFSEFYLVDTTGSYVFFNNAGEAMFFMVRAASDFETMHCLADDSNASQSVLDDLLQRKAYPFEQVNTVFPNKEGENLEKLMVNVNKLSGKEIYYALVKLAEQEIYSFDKCIKTL